MNMEPRMKTTSLLFIAAILAIIAGVLMLVSSWGKAQRAAQSNLPQQQVTQNQSQPATTTPASSGCVVGGCSKELCMEASDVGQIVSACIYRSEFACYKSAVCERQASGKCDWTPTPVLQTCIANARTSEGSPVAN